MKAFILLAIFSITFSYINCLRSNGHLCFNHSECASHHCDTRIRGSLRIGVCRATDLDTEMEAIEENFGDFSGKFMILAFILGATLGAVFMNLKFRRDFSYAKMEQVRYELGNLVTAN